MGFKQIKKGKVSAKKWETKNSLDGPNSINGDNRKNNQRNWRYNHCKQRNETVKKDVPEPQKHNKRCNICVIRVLEREKKESKAEKIVEKIMLHTMLDSGQSSSFPFSLLQNTPEGRRALFLLGWGWKSGILASTTLLVRGALPRGR